MRQSRNAGFIIISVVYVLAAIIGITLFQVSSGWHVYWRLLIGDVGATAFVYFAGVLLHNASAYDPYWSVAPIIILTGLAVYYAKMSSGAVLLLLAVWYWGIRLTANWAFTFKNLDAQDWRYDGFKNKCPLAFPLISFFGIHMFPTAVVYLCILPGAAFIENSALNFVTILGFAICVCAATLQLFADNQMRRFRRENVGRNLIIRAGLWKNARHPNYLGEIMMWWGIYVIMLSAIPRLWFLCVGAVVNTLMFLFVSIPMADTRNRQKRAGFDEYVKETNSLLPFPKIKRQTK